MVAATQSTFDEDRAPPPADDVVALSAANTPYSNMEEVMAHLEALNHPSYTARMLNEGYRAQRDVLTWIRRGGLGCVPRYN